MGGLGFTNEYSVNFIHFNCKQTDSNVIVMIGRIVVQYTIYNTTSLYDATHRFIISKDRYALHAALILPLSIVFPAVCFAACTNRHASRTFLNIVRNFTSTTKCIGAKLVK